MFQLDMAVKNFHFLIGQWPGTDYINGPFSEASVAQR